MVSKEELIRAVWDGRVADDALTSRVSAARRAIGDTGAEQRFIRTMTRRGFRFVADVQEDPDISPTPTVQLKALDTSGLQQSVRFCQTADRVHLAVATAGRGTPLVKTANWLNHIEFDWQSPVWSPLFSRLAAQCTLVRYDERGIGLSDRDVPDFSFEAFVDDLETVVDEYGLQRFALLGISQGAPVSIAYAVRHPERVSRLVLCGGFAKGWRKRGNAADVARAEASVTLIREGWGQDNPAARQMFTSLIVPMPRMRRCSGSMNWSASPHLPKRPFVCCASSEISTSRVVASSHSSHARVPQPRGCSSAFRAWSDAGTIPKAGWWLSRVRTTSSSLMSQRGRASSMRCVNS